MIYKLLTIFLISTSAYVFGPITKYVRTFDNKLQDINVVEKTNLNKKNTTCIVFCSGGSSCMPSHIYSHLFDNIVSNDFSIYAPSFNYQNKNKLIEELNKEYKEIIVAGHSSGATTAINYSKNKIIKKIILIDPVDTRLFSKKYRNKIHELKNLDNILFLNAEKSYKITFNPPGLAFIPFLAIKPDILSLKKSCKIINIEALNFGHADILDIPYCDIMHKTRLAVGNSNRSFENIQKYHNWIKDIFVNFSRNKISKLKKLKEIDSTYT